MINRVGIEEYQQREIIYTYQKILERVADATRKLASDLNEICERKHYKPFVELAEACVSFYQEDVKRNILNQYEDWERSPNSLEAYILRMEAGDAALQTARTFQYKLENVIRHEMFPAIYTPYVDTSHPNVVEADFDELSRITNKYTKAVEQIKFDSRKEIEHKVYENTLYRCILEPTARSLESVKEAYKKITRRCATLKEEYQGKITAHQNITDNEVPRAEIDARKKGADAFDQNLPKFKVFRRGR